MACPGGLGGVTAFALSSFRSAPNGPGLSPCPPPQSLTFGLSTATPSGRMLPPPCSTCCITALKTPVTSRHGRPPVTAAGANC